MSVETEKSSELNPWDEILEKARVLSTKDVLHPKEWPPFKWPSEAGELLAGKWSIPDTKVGVFHFVSSSIEWPPELGILSEASLNVDLWTCYRPSWVRKQRRFRFIKREHTHPPTGFVRLEIPGRVYHLELQKGHPPHARYNNEGRVIDLGHASDQTLSVFNKALDLISAEIKPQKSS